MRALAGKIGLKRLVIRIANRGRRARRFQKKTDYTAKYGKDRFSPTVSVDRTFTQEAKLNFKAPGRNEVLDWQSRRRRELADLIGVRHELNVTMEREHWEAEDDVGRVSRWSVRMGGQIVPTYWGIPERQRTETCWLICLQGHTTGMHLSMGLDQRSEEKRINVSGDRDVGSWAMSSGFNVLCLEQIGLGEREERNLIPRHVHPCQDAVMHRLALGGTLMGDRVMEVAALARLVKETYGTNNKIGVIGNSLGGSVALYAAALSEYIDFVIGAGCISTFEDMLIKKSGRHCLDLYIPGIMKHFRFGEIIALAAPKVSILIHGIGDPLFSIRGFSKTVNEAKQVYEATGEAQALSTIVGFSGHRHYRDLTIAMLRKYPGFFGEF